LDEKRKARLALLMQIFLRASLPSIFSHQLMSLAGRYLLVLCIFYSISHVIIPSRIENTKDRNLQTYKEIYEGKPWGTVSILPLVILG
jgi:hypothetical protein